MLVSSHERHVITDARGTESIVGVDQANISDVGGRCRQVAGSGFGLSVIIIIIVVVVIIVMVVVARRR